MSEDMNKIPLIIYHANCIDGFTAAWIAHKCLMTEPSVDECELFPAKYGDEPPDVTDREVYILDFSYPRGAMIAMNYNATILRVLDHHKTAQEDCSDLDFCTFNMNKSGCILAWECFFPDEQPPNWIKCIEDRDLWKFERGATKNVHAYISSFPMEIRNWNGFYGTAVQDMAQMGHHIQRSINTSIDKMMKESTLLTFGEDLVATLNIPREHASEIGHQLLLKYPESDYAMTYYRRADNRWQYELRARKEDNWDVSEVAKTFGGGGHANAAGFMTSDLLAGLWSKE